jgi:spore coat protein U-like protein
MVLAGALALTATPCIAGKATYTMPVSLDVISGCTVSAAPLIFMMPTPANTTFDSTTTITVRCNPNLPYTIDIDNGLHALGTNRRVKHSTANQFLTYDIYKDPPRSQVWGRGNTRNLAGNAGPSGTVIYPVYGRLTGRSGATAGNYNDLVTVTVNF